MVEPKIEQPTENNNDDSTPFDDAGEDSEGGIGAKMRKIFANRKNLSAADRKRLEKERKARQLRRLRKLLTPKNAVVALHELQGPGMSEFTINTNGQETTAEIVVNNVRYEATAPNKHLAKARASEKALRDLVIAQMAKARQISENKTPAANNGNDAGNEDVEMTDVSESDDVPMLHLASYALYKLFNEWQNEGFDIPAIKPPKPAVKLTESGVHPLAPKVQKTKADLPSDAPTRHPTALLAFMRPQIPYQDLGSNNNNDPAKREFSVGVTVDGQQFIDGDGDDYDPGDELKITDPFIKKQIRTMLRPKTSNMILHSLLGGFKLDNIIFDTNTPPNEQSGAMTFNDVCYYANARNRQMVKTRLTDQIFRDMILGKMRTIMTEIYPNVDNPMKLDVDAEVFFANDTLPLNELVAYALHKLQETWSLDGYSLPDYRPKAKKRKNTDKVPPLSCTPKVAKGINDLPDISIQENPTRLLAYMRPLARYKERLLTPDVSYPWFMFTLAVEGRDFSGEARSKKLARRIAAAKACSALFGIRYPGIDYE